ncbi:MAG: outer membrane lipoprotein-sorting protein [Gammaproteobacteria bacterium]
MLDIRSSLAVFLAIADTAVVAAPVFGDGVAEVRACVEAAAPRESATTRVAVDTFIEGEAAQSLTLSLQALRDADGRGRVLLRVEAPPDLAGYAVLARERDDGDPEVHTYLPTLRSVRRMSGSALSGALFGTDLTYEDLLELLAFTREGHVARAPDIELEGRPAYVLIAQPGGAGESAYAEIRTEIDRATCVLRRATFSTRQGVIAKTLEVPWDAVRHDGPWAIPALVVATNPRKHTETRLRTLEVHVDPGLRESEFSVTGLARGR